MLKCNHRSVYTDKLITNDVCIVCNLEQEIAKLREAAYRLFNADGSTMEPAEHFNEAIADLWNLLQAEEGGDEMGRT